MVTEPDACIRELFVKINIILKTVVYLENLVGSNNMNFFNFIRNIFKRKSIEIHGEFRDITNMVVKQVNLDIQKNIKEIIKITSIKSLIVSKLQKEGIKVNVKDIHVSITYNPNILKKG